MNKTKPYEMTDVNGSGNLSTKGINLNYQSKNYTDSNKFK